MIDGVRAMIDAEKSLRLPQENHIDYQGKIKHFRSADELVDFNSLCERVKIILLNNIKKRETQLIKLKRFWIRIMT